ncbi:hypothetical protein [Pseudovibrio japonicus]|uniref:hypothetical protein n=1 Tax=Pseudovibrio japonicus TaxID=366534 RepID=UPI001AD8FCB3|nr:hypothetical protein [Pseudovibrio japonicus]
MFAVLGKANVWLDTTTNTLLALGYRFGLVVLPLTLYAFGAKSLVVSLTAMAVGAALFSLQDGVMIALVAACFFAYGAAVSGYLIKNVAAQSKRGAANNRVAMNVGSLIAGLVIMIPFLTPTMFFWFAAVVVALCILLAVPRPVDTANIHVKVFQNQSAVTLIAWILVGMAMGMMLFGVFSVLPQTILKSGIELPVWYGSMIILNSAVVVFAQVPSLKLIEKAGRFRMLMILGFIFMGFSLLAFPDVLYVHTLVGAIIWVVLVSIAECAFGHIDYYSVQHKTMFVKEICIGLGAGLTVLLMRSVPLPYSSMLIGALGALFTLAWWGLTHRDLRNFD